MNTQTLTPPESLQQQSERRYLILNILHQSNDRTMNEIILNMILMDTFDIINPDDLRADLFWLQEQGLVLIQIHQGLHVAELTSFGVQFVNRQEPVADVPVLAKQILKKNGTIKETVATHNLMTEEA